MTDATAVLDRARAAITAAHRPNPFVAALEAGAVSHGRLVELAAVLHRLVDSDRRSFALAATRHHRGRAGSLFLSMAQGEAEALALLGPLGTALGAGPADLAAVDPAPLTLAYPAFLTQTALTGSRSDLALALLACVEESGATYRRTADALVARYAVPEDAVAHFRYLGDTPAELLDQARDVLDEGLRDGDDATGAVRVAVAVHAFEALFWQTMSR